MFTLFDTVATLLVLTALLAWVNHLSIGLPNPIGLPVMGLAASLVLVGFEPTWPRQRSTGENTELRWPWVKREKARAENRPR